LGVGYRRVASNDGGVECLICGDRMRTLATHLPRRHGVSSAEYLRRYPGAALISEELRAIRRDLALDRGWARYWTRARIRAALKRDAKRRGRAPREREWRTRRGRPRADGTKAPARSRPTAPIVLREYGSWEAALKDAGLTPSNGRTALHTHCKRGHPLTADNVYERDGRRVCRICHLARQARYNARTRAKLTAPKEHDARPAA
jgi:hypothetical protein